MVVTFTKVEGGRGCSWVAMRPKRRRTAGHMGVGHDRLPHDLAGFAVESRLGLDRGFWGLVEMGATFKSLNRKRTKPGRAIIRDNVRTLDEAEDLANLHWRRWREGRETPLRPTFDSLLAVWQQLPDGGSISLEWPSGRFVQAPGRAHVQTAATLNRSRLLYDARGSEGGRVEVAEVHGGRWPEEHRRGQTQVVSRGCQRHVGPHRWPDTRPSLDPARAQLHVKCAIDDGCARAWAGGSWVRVAWGPASAALHDPKAGLEGPASIRGVVDRGSDEAVAIRSQALATEAASEAKAVSALRALDRERADQALIAGAAVAVGAPLPCAASTGPSAPYPALDPKAHAGRL